MNPYHIESQFMPLRSPIYIFVNNYPFFHCLTYPQYPHYIADVGQHRYASLHFMVFWNPCQLHITIEHSHFRSSKVAACRQYWLFILCIYYINSSGLSAATIEYSCPSVCVSVCISVCTINNNGSIHLKHKHIAVMV